MPSTHNSSCTPDNETKELMKRVKKAIENFKSYKHLSEQLDAAMNEEISWQTALLYVITDNEFPRQDEKIIVSPHVATETSRLGTAHILSISLIVMEESARINRLLSIRNDIEKIVNNAKAGRSFVTELFFPRNHCVRNFNELSLERIKEKAEQYNLNIPEILRAIKKLENTKHTAKKKEYNYGRMLQAYPTG